MPVKAFISYSWSSVDYQESVLDIADRLQKSGIEVIVDVYDLKEGHDVIAFMERLSLDDSISFVLVFSDAKYTQKANAREKGVGTEAQIISKAVYESVTQQKFIPIVMERTETDEAFLPEFMRKRKYIDFSSPELQHQNWETLLRLLHGQPRRTKPMLGPVPDFSEPAKSNHFLETKTKFSILNVAMQEGRRSLPILRMALIDTFVLEWTRIFTELNGMGEALPRWEQWLEMNSAGRAILVDWFYLESKMDAQIAADECIIPIVERLFAFFQDRENPIDGVLRDAGMVFLREVVLYSTACLMDGGKPTAIRSIFKTPIIGSRDSSSVLLGIHQTVKYSEMSEIWNRTLEQRWLSPEGANIKSRAHHARISFSRLIEADALIFVYSFTNSQDWYPVTAGYSERGGAFPWFAKAKHSTATPNPLAVVTGQPSWIATRDHFVEYFTKELKSGGWTVFRHSASSFIDALSFSK